MSVPKNENSKNDSEVTLPQPSFFFLTWQHIKQTTMVLNQIQNLVLCWTNWYSNIQCLTIYCKWIKCPRYSSSFKNRFMGNISNRGMKFTSKLTWWTLLVRKGITSLFLMKNADTRDVHVLHIYMYISTCIMYKITLCKVCLLTIYIHCMTNLGMRGAKTKSCSKDKVKFS